MKSHELANILLGLPDLEVHHVWDGAARTCIRVVWLAKGGFIATADSGEIVYDDEDRPMDAPTKEEDKYWNTGGNGGF